MFRLREPAPGARRGRPKGALHRERRHAEQPEVQAGNQQRIDDQADDNCPGRGGELRLGDAHPGLSATLAIPALAGSSDRLAAQTQDVPQKVA